MSNKTVGLIQIPHQPLGDGTNIFCSLFIHTDTTCPSPPTLKPRTWGSQAQLPHSATSGERLSSLSRSLPHPCPSLQQECCGTSGPMDWVNFTSAFRAATPEVVFPWPPLCCRRTGNFIPLNEEGCRLGHTDYLFTKVRPPCCSPVCLGPSVLLALPPSHSLLLFPSLALSFSPLSLAPPTLSPSSLPSLC